VISSDGLVDCTATCTVTAPVGRVVMLRGTPSATFTCPRIGDKPTCDMEISPIDPFNVSGIQDVSVDVSFP
jgi:hypothetical protein